MAFLYLNENIKKNFEHDFQMLFAQSAGAVEYTVCTSAVG